MSGRHFPFPCYIAAQSKSYQNGPSLVGFTEVVKNESKPLRGYDSRLFNSCIFSTEEATVGHRAKITTEGMQRRKSNRG